MHMHTCYKYTWKLANRKKRQTDWDLIVLSEQGYIMPAKNYT